MLERKITELQGELERKRDDQAILTSQTRQIEEEKRRLQKHLTEVDRDKKNEQKKIEELELHAENAQRLTKKLNDDKEVGEKTLSLVGEIRICFSLRIYLWMNI